MADTDITHSEKSTSITKDDVTLKIEIYREGQEQEWALEVVAENGTSTVWDELFDDDAAALEEALEVIENEGGKSFMLDDNVIQFPNRQS